MDRAILGRRAPRLPTRLCAALLGTAIGGRQRMRRLAAACA
jgi:hypothetical protein